MLRYQLDTQTISEIVGLSKSHVSTLWKKYERGEVAAENETGG